MEAGDVLWLGRGSTRRCAGEGTWGWRIWRQATCCFRARTREGGVDFYRSGASGDGTQAAAETAHRLRWRGGTGCAGEAHRADAGAGEGGHRAPMREVPTAARQGVCAAARGTPSAVAPEAVPPGNAASRAVAPGAAASRAVVPGAAARVASWLK
eukprot:352399-Chlamydomonas_euryale.AAC.5